MNKKELWLKLRAYHFEHLVPKHLWDQVIELFGGENAATKAFASKLCRKNKWSMKYALLAISEYKKFLYLGQISDFIVTPSKAIDKVWHEHGLFMKPYEDFCNEVLGGQFYHMPELIPDDKQTGTFNAQYLDTLALYEREFNMKPPSEVWDVPKFDPEKVVEGDFKSAKRKRKKHAESSSGYTLWNDDVPLYNYFFFGNPDSPSINDTPIDTSIEFGGGEFGGGGASASWDNQNDHDSQDNNDDTTNDSNDSTDANDTPSSDFGDTGGDTGGDSGGDGGGSCSGGGSCGSCGG